MTPETIRRAGAVEIALLVMIALIWASAFTAIKIAVTDTGPYWLATIRVAIGAMVVLPFALWRGVRLPRSARIWALVAVMAALNIAIPFVLIAWGQQRVDAGMAALLMGTGPFMALIGSHLFTHDDKINRFKLTAMVCGFCGVALLVGDSVFDGTGTVTGQIAVLAGAMCYAVSGLIIRRIDLPPVHLAAQALLVAVAMLVPAALILDGPLAAPPGRPALWALVYLGALPTGLAYVMRYFLIRRIGYSTFSLSIYMIPPFGVLIGFLVLGETIGLTVMVSLGLILAGLYFARRGSGPAIQAAPRPVEASR